MHTIVLTMRLKPGCLTAYRKAHEDLWPEIASSMAANGVSMAIFHDSGQLFVFANAPTEAHWQRSRKGPALERWDAMMTAFLESNEPGKIAFQHPEKVFGFGEFK